MKGAIIYSSKYGTTSKVANALLNRYSDYEVYNLSNNDLVDLDHFDEVIIGSSIYVGKIRKDMMAFLQSNESKLLEKNLKIFICGMHEEEKDLAFQNSFSKELLEHAQKVEHFGGAFVFEKMNFFERIIVKKIAKVSKSLERIHYDKIEAF